MRFFAATLFATLLLAGPAAAQESPAAEEPATSATDVLPPKPGKTAAAPEDAKQPAPAEEPKKEAVPSSEEPKEEAKAQEAKPAAKPEAKPEAKAPTGHKMIKKVETALLAPEPAPKIPLPPGVLAEAEWKFLKDAAADTNRDVTDATIEDLEGFVDQYPEARSRPDALFLLAGVRQRRGDWKEALVDYLRLLHEYPSSKSSLQAKSAFLELGGSKLSRKLKPVLSELVKTPQVESAPARLTELLGKLCTHLDDSLYEPAVREFRRFAARFPDFAGADSNLFCLAQVHMKGDKPAQALLAYRKLLAVYPESAHRSQAQFALGTIYAESLRDYKKAIDAFQELADKYPDSPDVLRALERSAELFTDRLKQYELAVEVNERIVKLFPKTDGALKAFETMAKLQRDRLRAPGDAIKTYLRIPGQFRYPSALEALRSAATIARKDLKDYQQEAQLRARISSDFPNTKEAAEELFSAAEVYEDDLKDLDKAVSVYKDVAAKFPGTREAKKAQDRAQKLEKKKAQP